VYLPILQKGIDHNALIELLIGKGIMGLWNGFCGLGGANAQGPVSGAIPDNRPEPASRGNTKVGGSLVIPDKVHIRATFNDSEVTALPTL